MSDTAMDSIDMLTASLLLSGSVRLLNATTKSLISDRAWQVYMRHKTKENLDRHNKICKILYPKVAK